MSGKTIGQLTAASSITGVDKFETEQVGSSKYCTAEQINEYGYVEVTGNYTIQPGERYFNITTADGVLITIPDTLNKNTPLIFNRTVASTTSVSVISSGSETVEGTTASFVVCGAKAVSELDPSEVVLRKMAGDDWRFVNGTIKGSVSTLGTWIKYANGVLEQKSIRSFNLAINTGNGALYISDAIGERSWPIQFASIVGEKTTVYSSDGSVAFTYAGNAPTINVAGSLYLLRTTAVGAKDWVIDTIGYGKWRS